DDESVFVTLGTREVRPGASITAALVNASDHTVGHGVLPCTAALLSASTLEPVGEPRECIQPMLLLRPGQVSAFAMDVPAVPGEYLIEIHASDEDREPPVAGLPLRIRSPSFTVRVP